MLVGSREIASAWMVSSGKTVVKFYSASLESTETSYHKAKKEILYLNNDVLITQ